MDVRVLRKVQAVEIHQAGAGAGFVGGVLLVPEPGPGIRQFTVSGRPESGRRAASPSGASATLATV